MYTFVTPLKPEDIYHHGTKGMHWGVKNGPPYPIVNLQKIKRNTKTANVDSWGKSKDTNILYVTGYSGSGKSTKAQEIAKARNAEVIHLDIYLEQVGKDSFKSDSNKNFNKFLKRKGYDRERYLKLIGSKNPDDKKKRWKIIDELGDHISEYGEKLYGKKKTCRGRCSAF